MKLIHVYVFIIDNVVIVEFLLKVYFGKTWVSDVIYIVYEVW